MSKHLLSAINMVMAVGLMVAGFGLAAPVSAVEPPPAATPVATEEAIEPVSLVKDSIVVYTALEDDQVTKYLDLFKAQYPNIEVQIVRDSTGIVTAKFLAEKGPGIHHLCIEVDDIDSMLADLKQKGVRLIDETARELPGRKMAFIHPKATGGVLLELYQLTGK